MGRYAGDPENRIRMWLQHILPTGGIERFDELHIDEIDPAWADRTQWLEGMTKGLEAVRTICTELAPDKVPALICSLEDGPRELPASLEELVNQFDWSPPAFYLFHRGQEPWNLPSAVSRLIDLPLDDFIALNALRVFVSEWDREDCLRRSFYAL